MNLSVVLTIAGTDPTAGAGLQADCKTITVLGGYAVSAVTAVVAQNTQGVRTFSNVEESLLRAQLDAIAQDTTINAIKIGMLGSAPIIREVINWIESLGENAPPVVVDPVMVATSGDSLFDPSALHELRKLIALSTVVTPNNSELAALTGNAPAKSFENALLQGHQLSRDLNVAVVVKGGHLLGDAVTDALILPQTSAHNEASTVVAQATHPRVPTHRTHGTGCGLSSAIATKLARQPHNLVGAFLEARTWLQRTIEHADLLAFGKGNGPIHHTAMIADDAAAAPAQTLLPARDVEGALSGWWDSCERIRQATDQLLFVQELGDGSLSSQRFAHYLQQDALYLREYSRALAVAADLAPTLMEQRFWMQGAYQSLIIERGLHDSWLASQGLDLDDPEPTAVTLAYTEHFLDKARARNYSELIAAMLPCYWMYQDIGSRLAAQYQRPGHPYGAWLASYADPKFAQSTLSARAIVANHVLQLRAEGQERMVQAMHQAFLESCQYEHDFFAVPELVTV